ncbi:hypothetical protein D1007_62260 [Hordeum vulgare]|nr:hypothetical protein D1007_62260 [Hordeum vulgare]
MAQSIQLMKKLRRLLEACRLPSQRFLSHAAKENQRQTAQAGEANYSKAAGLPCFEDYCWGYNPGGPIRSPMVVAGSSESGLTEILPASTPLAELSTTSIALHLPTLFFGLLPTFSEFFSVVLTHYQIHVLYLDPRFILILSFFAFLCEALLGIPPLMVLFRTLQLTAPNQPSGCASFQAVVAIAGECIDMKIDHFTEGFRRKWVYVDMG